MDIYRRNASFKEGQGRQFLYNKRIKSEEGKEREAYTEPFA